MRLAPKIGEPRLPIKARQSRTARFHHPGGTNPGCVTFNPMSRKPEGTLRKGWTTGACATAATAAAYRELLTGQFADEITISLPKGERPTFALTRA